MAIQVPPDSTGKLVETNSPDGSTQRQVITVGDKTTAANTLAITAGGAAKTDGSATTQPISAASLPLPTGAATAAKQPALGTAGSASADVISVQGVASMTALKVDGSGVTQPVSGTVAATQSGTWTVQPGNTANTTAWKVDGSAVTQPVSAASLPLPSGASTAAKQPALGTAGSPSVDVITIQGVTSMTPLKVDGSGVTQPVSFGPATTGGTSAYHVVAAASNNSASIKGSAGQIYGWSIFNNAAYPIFVKLYNKATAPAPATDNALLIRVIGVQSDTHVTSFNQYGIAGFTNGIGVAVVKGITDTDNTSLLASDGLIEIDYK